MPRSLCCSRALVLAALLAAGCGGKKAEIPEVGKAQLQDIWLMYSEYSQQSGKPPAKADDLKVQARGSPSGGRPLRDPDFVILYGTPVGGTNVLAYQKDVPTQGGFVLLSDGTVKTMAADEFQAAPKGGK